MRMGQKTVCWILGTAYSGSSLLNLLLDGQPGVRGMGEAIHLVSGKTDPWCTVCQTAVMDCKLKKIVDSDEFYRSVFQFYSDCEVLIDSSKWWKYCAVDHGVESEIHYKAIFLSKTPHEFAYSLIHHNSQANTRYAFLDWIQCYRSTIQAAKKASQLAADDVMSVPFRNIADAHPKAVRDVCRFLDIPFDPGRVEEWWLTDSHIIGGNNAVHAQTAGSKWFEESKDYLQGKYSGKYRKIFRDDHWRLDAGFLNECGVLYKEMADELDPVLVRLGHSNSEVLIEELLASP